MSPAGADQGVPPGPLVSADWLEGRLGDPSMRVLDVRGRHPSSALPHAKRAEYSAEPHPRSAVRGLGARLRRDRFRGARAGRLGRRVCGSRRRARHRRRRCRSSPTTTTTASSPPASHGRSGCMAPRRGSSTAAGATWCEEQSAGQPGAPRTGAGRVQRATAPATASDARRGRGGGTVGRDPRRCSTPAPLHR